jgi:hypothetical protein
MCSKCGKEFKDIATRAVTYGVLRWAVDTKPVEGLIGSVVDVQRESMNMPVKVGLNAAVDYAYDQWVYDAEKLKGYQDYLGLCPCEYMKGAWQIVAQLVYEGAMGKVSMSDVIKEIIAVFGEFPIQHIVQSKITY